MDRTDGLVSIEPARKPIPAESHLRILQPVGSATERGTARERNENQGERGGRVTGLTAPLPIVGVTVMHPDQKFTARNE